MSDQAAQIMPVVVVLPAEIDVTNSRPVHDQLVAALETSVDIVIADMTATSFCDSSGVHAVMFAHLADDLLGIAPDLHEARDPPTPPGS